MLRAGKGLHRETTGSWLHSWGVCRRWSGGVGINIGNNQHSEEDEDEDEYVEASETDDSHPLLIMFNCEMTGFSIYSDHITDIAAKS